MTQKVVEIVKQVCQKEGIVGDIVDEYSIMVEPDFGPDQTMTLGGGKTLTMTMGRNKTLGANATLSPDVKGSPGEKGHVGFFRCSLIRCNLP